MSTTLSEELASGRALRCRYIRKDGVRCSNKIAGGTDDPTLLCPKHLFEAWRQFAVALKGRKVST